MCEAVDLVTQLWSLINPRCFRLPSHFAGVIQLTVVSSVHVRVCVCVFTPRITVTSTPGRLFANRTLAENIFR